MPEGEISHHSERDRSYRQSGQHDREWILDEHHAHHEHTHQSNHAGLKIEQVEIGYESIVTKNQYFVPKVREHEQSKSKVRKFFNQFTFDENIRSFWKQIIRKWRKRIANFDF